MRCAVYVGLFYISKVHLQLYLSEIMSSLIASLSSTSWQLKRQAALALAEVARTGVLSVHYNQRDHCDHSDHFSASAASLNAYVEQLLKLLLDSIPGRLWKGNECSLLPISYSLNASSYQYLDVYLYRYLHHIIIIIIILSTAGKEALLETLAVLCVTCKSALETRPLGPQSVLALVLKECQRNDKDYKNQALQALEKVL